MKDPKFEKKVEMVLTRMFHGIHHVPGWEKREPFGDGIRVVVKAGLASYDFPELTSLVVACHDLAVRVEIHPAGARKLALCFHPRRRDGQMWERHPRIEEAVAGARRQAEAWEGK